ncbi:polyamine ABC transporter substrate-binding protein [Bradyrhizobium sp. Arg62]|nr:polyamine ABC transporter substrate-binding protein [Bradyrhizobium brasilense]MCC8951536.1 polyamine ABC transporter substrate-binding protein [Bradyrhizobium brasilense]
MTITTYGGAYAASLRGAIFEPFSKATGIKITEDEYNGEIAKIRAMVQSNTVSWDVVDASPELAMQLCAEGYAETIDWKKLGLDQFSFIGGDQNDCAVPNVVSAAVIAYDKDKLPNGPKTIADLFDTKKIPGKRGLNKAPRINLEWALIADGVPFNDVYKVLRTPEGVDRAFRKLDMIKGDVVWYSTFAQAAQLLADGQVVMTSVLNGRIYDAVKNAGKHFEIMWDARQLLPGVWMIPKGSQRLDAAYKFIAYASSPQALANLAQKMPYGPANKAAIALVDPAMRPNLPTASDHTGSPLLRDAAFWAEKSDELNQRFTAWLAK